MSDKLIHFRYDALGSPTGNYTQTLSLSLNGNVVSTLSTSPGATASGWVTAVECNGQDNCGMIPLTVSGPPTFRKTLFTMRTVRLTTRNASIASAWTTTQMVLAQADPSYVNTVGRADGASGGDALTSDGGYTFDLTTISIPEWTFPGSS